MKAVVLEIKDGYAAVLSEDGQFIKIKNDSYTPGMELTLEEKAQNEKTERKDLGKLINLSTRRLWYSVATVAAALLIFIGVKDFNTPYGTISLDVNPSIEISINRYDRVLGIEAVNDDATEIVDELNSSGLKYKSVDDAVDMALDSFSEGGYAAEDGTTYVMISANSESEKHSDKIASELDSVCNEHEDISAQTITADDELVKRAREHGTTAGKQYLVDSLKEVSGSSDFDEADWLKKPVKDIMHEIDSKGKPSSDTEPSQDPGDAQKPEDAPSDAQEPLSDPDNSAEPQDMPKDTGEPQGKTAEPNDLPKDDEKAPDADAPDKAHDQFRDGQDDANPPEKPEDGDGQAEPGQTGAKEQNQPPEPTPKAN